MRASTLFALTIAILIGLGVAVTAKMMGLFDRAEPAAVQKAPVKVLAAKVNLFAGNLIQPSHVYIRDLKPEEVEEYQRNKDVHLSPVQTSVYLRVAKNNIVADQIITNADLEKLTKPQSLPERLVPTMRAISLSVEKDKSAGGLIQVGDWVDVLLTSKVTDRNGGSSTRTATVAPRVRVIAKRNSLWPVFADLPEEKPVQFTLEVNPYRAALIEYVKNHGELSITPLPANEQHQLEAQRDAVMKQGDDIKQVHFMKAGTVAAEREDALVGQYSRGDLVVNEHDLVTIFGLTTNAPPEAPVIIEQIGGLNHYRPAVFSPADGKRVIPGYESPNAQISRNSPTLSYQFAAPESDYCPECKLKSKNNGG